jgi:hypothetical protein
MVPRGQDAVRALCRAVRAAPTLRTGPCQEPSNTGLAVHADDAHSWSWLAEPEPQKPAPKKWYQPRRSSALSRSCSVSGPRILPARRCIQNDTGGEAFEPDGSAARYCTTSIMGRKPDALIA